VEKLARAGKVARLLRALQYEDQVTDRDGRTVDLGASVRAQAAHALAAHDDPLAIEGLLRAAADPEEVVRVAAIRALRERGGPAPLDALFTAAITWTDDERAQARAEAADALVDIADPQVPRRAVAELLAREHELEPFDCELLGRLARAPGGVVAAETIADLIAHLGEASAPDRASALLVALAPDSVEPMIDALADGRSRDKVAGALGEAQDVRAVEALCTRLIQDDDPAVRRASARALGSIRHPAAVETLLVASRDSDYETRSAAIDAFDQLGNTAVAVAVGVMIGPALRNGSEAHEEVTRPAEEPAPQMEPPRPQPEAHAPLARSSPMLRRLLGR
jgi:HEAT repeat protein